MLQLLKASFKLQMKFVQILKWLVVITAAATIVLIISCMIPNERIKQHIEQETTQQTILSKMYYCMWGGEHLEDNLMPVVDAFILNCLYNEKSNSFIKDALVYRQYIGDTINLPDALQADVALRAEAKKESDYKSYECYWLGYTAPLRVLLSIMSYRRVVQCFTIFMWMITILTFVYSFIKTGDLWIPLAYYVMLYSINYVTLIHNIYLGGIIFAISSLGICALLSGKVKNHMLFMLVIGCITAYYDYFSVPFVTWGILLCVELYRINEKKITAVLNLCTNSSVGWCVGYGWMILSKTLVALPVNGLNAFKVFAERFLIETVDVKSDYGPSVWRMITCLHPLSTFSKGGIQVLLLIMLLSVIYFMIQDRKNYIIYIAYMLIGISPMVWFWVFKGHIHHYFLDYRTLAISVFAWAMSVAYYSRKYAHRSKLRTNISED